MGIPIEVIILVYSLLLNEKTLRHNNIISSNTFYNMGLSIRANDSFILFIRGLFFHCFKTTASLLS